MISLRDKLVFCAGAMFLHTISHGMLYLMGITIDIWNLFSCTPTFNLWTTIISGIITVGLFVWIASLKKA